MATTHLISMHKNKGRITLTYLYYLFIDSAIFFKSLSSSYPLIEYA